MRKLLSLLLLSALFTSTKAQVTVSSPVLTYTSLNAAFAAINNGVHTGVITIDITGNTTEGPVGFLPTPLAASGQSLASYTSITIRPTIQATVSGAPATGRGVIELDGADNVTINGDIVGGPVQRDLSIQNNNAITVAATAVIRLIGRTTGGLGATNNTITNCHIRGNTEGNNGSSGSTVANSYGIYAGGNTVNLAAGGLGDNYDNNVFTNNEINKAYFGIWIGSTTANPADNNIISNNIIGSNTVGETITFAGVSLSSVVTNTITQNEIFNLKANTSISNFGIQITGTSSNSVTISRNKIYGIHSTSTGGWGAYGINLIGGNNHLVVNNVIYDLLTVNYLLSTTFNAFGIRITSGTGHRVYYNTVNLFGELNTPTTNANSYSSCFLVTVTSVTGLDVRNNIFNNVQTTTLTTATTKKYFCLWFPTSYNFANVNLNNNAYNITSSSPDHFIGKVGTTANTNEATNLTAWQAFSQVGNPTNDIASIPLANSPAPFTSNTLLTIPANTNYGGESGAVLIPALGTNIDHNANVRPLAGSNPNTGPDMGAYEFDGVNGVPNDAGINNLVNPPVLGCYSSNQNVQVTIRNYGVNNISNIPVTVVVSGPINQTLTGTYTGTIAPSTNFNFSIGNINMTAPGVYNFKSWTSYPGDSQNINDTLANVTRTVVAPATLPQFVGFTGFTGANLPTAFPGWFEAQGASLPTGTISNWINQANLNSAGNVNARIFMSAVSANDWIVGPKVVATASTMISFDAAVTSNISTPFTNSNMGSDDRVRLMISTDCGASFTPIFTLSATNSLTTNWTNFNVNLSAYNGQEIILAFLAQDGPIDDLEAYYFHLENINLYNASATDAGVSNIISPSSGCFGANENVVVNLNNYGTASLSNIPVTVWVNGAVTQTLNGIFAGPLAPNASAAFTVGTINMTTAGNYSFNAHSALAGDPNIYNDTNVVVKTSIGISPLPQTVSFSGFNGSNLPTFFPVWREAQGTSAAGTGTTSNWISGTGLSAPTNTTARVQLFTNTRNEWIVGPRVTATNSTVISFDAAVTDLTATNGPATMGSDDMVRLMISTDCGLSYAPIFTLSAANNLPNALINFNVNLSSYAGQDIIVAFFATDGPVDDLESYYFHLDNINLYNNVATDGGVTAILSPTINACLSTSEPVVVTVNNFGLGPISNFPVTAVITGPLNSTVTSNFTGTLAPNTSATFTIGTANMNLSGTYTINAFTGVSGDPNAFNDGTLLITTQTPAFGIAGGNVVCSAGSQTLSVTGSATSYTWSNSSNSNSIVVTPTATTTYSAIGTGTNNCQVSAFFTVSVLNPTIVANGTSVCNPTTVATLTANAFGPVSWYASPTATTPLATGNTFTTLAATTTTYYAEANSISSGSLTTTFAAGNGCGGGTMFDITATNGAVVIDSLDINTSVAANTTLSVIIYYKTGGYVGNELTPAAWTAWDTIIATSAGANQPTRVPFNIGLNIPNNSLHAIYVNYNSQYTNGTNAYSNADITLQMGAGLCSQFGGVNPGRMFNGNVYYSKPGCTSPKIPVTVTVSPTPTLTANSSTNTVCAGTSVTLTASGVDSYTWSTSSTNASIVETPTVTTNYTVTGLSNACNITLTETLNVNVNALPTVSLSASINTICALNGSISLAGTPAGGIYSGTAVTGSLLSVANAGTFTPMYSYTNTLTGCSNSATTQVIVANCTGIDEAGNSISKLSVYPNPNNGSFTIETGNILNKQIEILDITGRVVYSANSEAQNILIDVRELAHGMYQVKVKTNTGTDIIKVIKQ
jgi:trimeric autotransporter adhesin